MNFNDHLIFSNPSRETLCNDNYINNLENQHEELKRFFSINIMPEEYKEENQEKQPKRRLKKINKKSLINIEEENK